MLIILGVMTATGGLFLILWYRTVVLLPMREQPPFIHPATFKWGVPLMALLLILTGLLLLAMESLGAAAACAGVMTLAAFLLLRFDRYSAEIRDIHDRYRAIRASNPSMEDVEVLFRTARWRYPEWSQDRLVELIAGKDIQSLILLMLIGENKINPIADWELYRTLKLKVARIARSEMRGEVMKSLVVILSCLLIGSHGALLARAAQGNRPAVDPAQVPKYMEITSRLGTGGQPTDEGLRDLTKAGYQAIICLRTPEEGVDLAAEEKKVRDLGLQYFNIPVVGSDPKAEQALEFLDLMDRLKEKKVFVHCASANRVGSFVMIQRALKDGVSLEMAEEEANQIGLRSDVLRKFATDFVGSHKK